MLKREGKWLVAVSGGPDSMALVGMCLDANMDIGLAHVNYHHRAEADEEEAYVVSFAKEHHLPCLVQNAAFSAKHNFEADAREWRYSFFANVIQEYGYRGLLVAHQEDDVLETYFMQTEKNLVPDTYGLKEEGMMHGFLLVRPLLHYTKQDLQNYCDVHSIRYYIDCTNEDETITRNRIRHQVVEKLSRMEREMVLKEMQMKNAEKRERTCRVATYVRSDKVSLQTYRALSQSDRDALLRMVLEKHGTHHYSLAHLHEIDAVIMKKKDFCMECGEVQLVQKDNFMKLIPVPETYCDTYETLEELQKGCSKYYRVENGRCGVHAVTLRESDFPVTIRSPKESDAIELRFGTKRVHRFFIDRHIPRFERKVWPVMENKEGQVIFVPGIGCDVHHYTVKPTVNVVEYSEY